MLPSVVGSVTAALLAYQAYQFDERVLRLWRTTFSKSDGPLVSRPRDGTDIRHRQRGAQTAHAISALMRANEFIVMSHHTFVLNELAKLRASVRSVAETSRTTCAFCAGLAAGGDGPPITWADLALANGYADQSHLVREFRRFGAHPPAHLTMSV